VSPLPAFLDWEKTFGILKYKNFYTNLLNEQLFLVHKGFSYQDVLIMPSHVRKYYLSMLQPKEE
jgi:hypothetical protein